MSTSEVLNVSAPEAKASPPAYDMGKKLELRKRSWGYRALNSILKCPYVLVAPAVIIALWLVVYPILYGAYVSFNDWDMFTGTMKWVGLKNYRYLFTNVDFLKSLGNTFVYMLVFVFGGLVLYLLLGIFLNKNTRVHNLVQTVIFTPHIISFVSVAVVFMWLMDPVRGLFNYVLELVGLPTSFWYMGTKSALGSVLFVAMWKGIGYGVLIVISGLRSIPEYVYEAARLDRSKKTTTFFRITIPLMSPTIFFLIVTTTVSSFCTFDIVKLMTQGGPDNASNLLAYYIYQQGFLFMHYGRAMAAAMILLVITGTLSLVNFLFVGKSVHYQ